LRIYQAAQHLGVTSKDLLDLLKDQGVDVKSPSSTVDEDTFLMAERLLNAAAAAPPPEPVKPKPVEPAPIPTKAGRVGAIPAGQKAGKKADGSDASPPQAVDEPGEAGEAAEASPEVEEPVVAAPPFETPVEVEVEESKPVEEPPPPEVQPVAPPAPTPVRRTPQPTGPIPVAQKGLRSMGGNLPPRPVAPGTAARRPREGVPTRPGSSSLAAPPTGSSLGRPPIGSRSAVPRRPDPSSPRPVMTYDEMMKERQRLAQAKAAPPPGAPASPGARPAPGSRRPGSFDDDARKNKKSAKDQRGGHRLDKRQLDRLSSGDDGEYRPWRKKQHHASSANRPSGPVVLETPITVRSFSAAAGITAKDIQTRLFKTLGMMATINAVLSEEQAQLLAIDFNFEIQVKGKQTAETRMETRLEAEADDPADLVARPPIVTFMGHVDHGKTSLMDRIRRANVAAGEAGGITQHIGAYQATLESGAKVTFLDTPGHQAFTAMRARGANLTDIVVLVVAADDGVMPQTEEAISHAQAAGVPIVVAINKSDLPGANPDKVTQQLAKYNLIAEKWGGDVQMYPTSAVTGAGVDELLEGLHLLAEIKELKGNAKRSGAGNVVEASMDPDAGVRATILVRNGTLRRGDVMLCGATYGRIRAMYDPNLQPIEEAGPSTPAVIFGLDAVPEAGQSFVVVDDLSKAREISGQRKNREREANRQPDQIRTLESLFAKKYEELNLIIKADVRGSLEALRKEIGQFSHNEVRVRIIHDGIGGINESDVELAHASDAIIVGFYVVPDTAAERLAADRGVEIRRYEIIYQVLDDIKKALEGLLRPESREVQLGRAVVKETFSISRVGVIAGCGVVSGTVERTAKLRVIREGVVIGAYNIESLKRVKDDVKEVRQGMDCGIKLANFDDIKVGDLLEAYKVEEIKRTLEG
jgi:translation initiation factor IF-2